MQGKIIRGIAGFYYVHVAGSGIYECKAKGIFRKENKKPLVGDNVEIDVLDERDREGNLVASCREKTSWSGRRWPTWTRPSSFLRRQSRTPI